MDKQNLCITPLQRQLLLKNLETDLSHEQRQRIEIMLLADQGQSQAQICRILGCTQETARYWIIVAQTGQSHTWNERPKGRPKRVNDLYLSRLEELVKHSPREYGYAFKRWTGQWLSKQLAKELGIKISACHVNRLLKQMGLSTKQLKTEETHQTNTNSKIKIQNLSSKSTPALPFQWFLKSSH